VGAEIAWEKLPRAKAIAGCPDRVLADDCLLAGGDDYELVFSAPASKRQEIEAAGRNLGIPLALVGAVVSGDPVVRLRDARGQLVSSTRKGFDHFA
jgi:thiamine-monophosphate kinase